MGTQLLEPDWLCARPRGFCRSWIRRVADAWRPATGQVPTTQPRLSLVVTAPVAKRLIEQAKRLPARDRRRVVTALEASLAKSPAARGSRLAIGAYESLLALAGTAHADVDDVSSNKYAHLAAAYARDT